MSVRGGTYSVVRRLGGRTPQTVWHKLDQRNAVAAIAVGASAILGAAAATDTGKIAIAGLIGTSLFTAFLYLYRRSPQLALIVVWLIQVFQAPLAAPLGYNSTGGHAIRECTDGLVVVLLVLTLLQQSPTGRRKQTQTVLLWVLAGLSLTGWISSLIHHVPIGISLLGWWLATKIWVLMIISARIPWRPIDVDTVYKIIGVVGVVVSILALIDYFGHGIVASNLHVNVTQTATGSYRSTAVQAIFINPGECSLFLSYLVALALSSYAERRRRADLLMFLLFAVTVLLTLRLKGVLCVGAVIALVILLRSSERRSNTITLLCVAALAAVMITAVEGQVVTRQVSQFTGNGAEGAIRKELYSGGFQLGSQEFPLGVGFGRYASDTARSHYSPIYYEMGFNNVWGLSPTYPMYLDDTSWPSVIGETGYAGLAIVLAGFAWLAIVSIRVVRSGSPGRRWFGVAAICVLTVTLVNSLGAPTLFDWLAALMLATIFGPLFAVDEEKPRDDKYQLGIA